MAGTNTSVRLEEVSVKRKLTVIPKKKFTFFIHCRTILERDVDIPKEKVTFYLLQTLFLLGVIFEYL